jgi:hypothetical protein
VPLGDGLSWIGINVHDVDVLEFRARNAFT